MVSFGTKKNFDQKIQEFKIKALNNVDKWAKEMGIIVDTVRIEPEEVDVEKIINQGKPDERTETVTQKTGKVIFEIVLAKSQADTEHERNQGFKGTHDPPPT